MGIAVEARCAVHPAAFATLQAELAHRTTLQEVVRWAFASGSDVADVIVQDEYTHDVVIPWRDHHLVFDTT